MPDIKGLSYSFILYNCEGRKHAGTAVATTEDTEVMSSVSFLYIFMVMLPGGSLHSTIDEFLLSSLCSHSTVYVDKGGR